MKSRQIINIVNFIRTARHADGESDSVFAEIVKKQIALMQKHGLRGTFLFQYDSLLDPAYTEPFRAVDPEQFELGVWLEIVRPQVEAAGGVWKSHRMWDWHSCHCMPAGYPVELRGKLADVQYEKFRERFGCYPRVCGAWCLDTVTTRHICEKYGADAFCNCKEQYGTDGYTLWGSYYGQAYYPSKINQFMPAQTREMQLDAPIFRMLGSDPVYQYDFGLSIDGGADGCQKVISLEPVYTGNAGGGGVPAWVDWYMKENFNGDCLSFGYAQAGQENTFGWEKMKGGLEYQFPLFKKLQDEGKIVCETLGESGRAFKAAYDMTPASAITAHTAFDDPEKSSVWYSCKNYRVNLYTDHGTFRIRDVHVFDERMPDAYEPAICPGNDIVYETLPWIDGNRHSGNGVLAGGYLRLADGSEPVCGEPVFTDEGGGCASIDYGPIRVTLTEDAVTIEADGDFTLDVRAGTASHMPEKALAGDTLTLTHAGARYTVRAAAGHFVDADHAASENGRLTLVIANA
ncbi:MAG: hypothetical protein IJF67_06410 [Clostridia bacterium]|nr:hypothetical protein [Clostridia bacterium]